MYGADADAEATCCLVDADGRDGMISRRVRLDAKALAQLARANRCQRWLRFFAQGVKWNFCLTARTLVRANQEKR